MNYAIRLLNSPKNQVFNLLINSIDNQNLLSPEDKIPFQARIKILPQKYNIELNRFNKQPTPNKELKKLVHNKLLEEWKEVWNTSSNSQLKHIKQIVNQYNPALKFKRSNQVLLTRLRIGHTKITHHHLFKKEDRKICELCKVPITVKHLLLECNKYVKEREKCFQNSDLDNLLNDTKRCKKVIDFFNITQTRHLI